MIWYDMEAEGIGLGPHGVLVESFLDGHEHLIAEVHALVAAGVKAQGVRRSTLHAEVRFHHDRPFLLEIAEGAVGLTCQLRERGYEPISADMSELIKAGGAVKCCTLELKAEVARS